MTQSDVLIEVKIPERDLFKLDGACDDAVQRVIDQRKQIHAARKQMAKLLRKADVKDPREQRIVIEVILISQRTGKLGKSSRSLAGNERAWCCGRSPGYKPYRVSGMHGKAGEPNLMKPEYLSTLHLGQTQEGIDVTVCHECLEMSLPAIQKVLTIIPTDAPEHIRQDQVQPYRCHAGLSCAACGWLGHFGTDERHLFTRGLGRRYLACPQCEAKSNRAFSQHDGTGFVVVDEAGSIIRDERTVDVDVNALDEAINISREMHEDHLFRDVSIIASNLGVSCASLLLGE